MNKIIWKLLFILLWVIIIAVSFSIDAWTVNAKASFPAVTYWTGIVLGLLEGIVSIEVMNAYKK